MANRESPSSISRRSIANSTPPASADWRRSVIAEYVEALLQLGRLDDGAAILASWEADAVRQASSWELAGAARCRGLLAAAVGDHEEAVALLEAAVAKHESVGDPFGRARALLALGIVRRRGRQKRAAREAIEAGLAGFEQLGARGWEV